MKILVLGGAGDMGAGGARLVLEYPEVEKVVLSDINKEAVEERAAFINSPKVETKVIDALNREELIEHAKEYDVVLNAVGPFVKFGVPILEAVIEAGTNYVDICDDHDATEGLLALDGKAKEKGVTALICMGTTPGITNVQAKLAHSLLDECDSLKICWAVGDLPEDLAVGTPLEVMIGVPPKEFISPAAWSHMLHVSEGKVPIWRNGKWDEIDSLEHGEWVDFSEPMGRTESYYLGHAEPTTLPKFLKINDFSACLGALQPEVVEELREEARGHKKATHPPKPLTTPVWEAPELWKKRGVWGGQAAIAEGTKDGEKVRYTVRVMMGIKDQDAYMYSGQATGMYMLGTGQIKKTGVLAPEACIDPKLFFEGLAKFYSMSGDHTFTADEVALIEKEVL